jgi:hypothetical protein
MTRRKSPTDPTYRIREKIPMSETPNSTSSLAVIQRMFTVALGTVPLVSGYNQTTLIYLPFLLCFYFAFKHFEQEEAEKGARPTSKRPRAKLSKVKKPKRPTR